MKILLVINVVSLGKKNKTKQNKRKIFPNGIFSFKRQNIILLCYNIASFLGFYVCRFISLMIQIILSWLYNRYFFETVVRNFYIKSQI